jgi:tRNA pseudouridine38-40 synthase
MADAARCLIGQHDFTTFRAAGCQAGSPLKTLDRLSIASDGAEIRLEVCARSFLYKQVRSMVGSLKLVGEGTWRASDLQAALAARARSACGPVAPARGLYLAKVDYAPSPCGASDGSLSHR